MKASGKPIGRLIVGCILACYLTSIISSFAIEGLQVSLQTSNIVLHWPSVEGEIYTVQYQSALNATSLWATLTSAWAADTGTNVTFFTHSNAAQYGWYSGGSNTNGSGGIPDPNNTNNVASSGTNNWSAGFGFYRVVRAGAHIYGLTNGMVLSGTVSLPIELALDSTDEVAGVTFYANGSPLIGATAEGDGYHWQLNWDTAMMPNGTNEITVGVDFTTETDATNSVPITVTINNAISFPNYFTRIYGDQMWIYAETIYPNASYRIDMYGQSTNYLGYFSGTTSSNGLISFLWGLSGLTDTNFYGAFTVPFISGNAHPLVADTSASKQTWAKESGWAQNLNDKYVIAYGPFDNSDYMNTKAINAIVGGPGGAYGGVIGTLDQYGLNGNLSPGNSAQNGSVFILNDGAAKTNLLSYLADGQYRSFYFLGHGSSSAIGGFNPSSKIGFYDIKRALGNFLTSPKPSNFHPYRFVFIDGCSAGKGNLSEAFGIPSQTLNSAFFANAGVHPRAFLGYKSWNSFNPQKWDWYALMMEGFFNDWMQGNTSLQTCVNHAVNGVYNAGQVTMDSSWVIYGASDLTRYTWP